MPIHLRVLPCAAWLALLAANSHAFEPRTCVLRADKPDVPLVKSIGWTAAGQASGVDFLDRQVSGVVTNQEPWSGRVYVGEQVNVYLRGEHFPGTSSLELMFVPQKADEYTVVGAYFKVRDGVRVMASLFPKTAATCSRKG